MNGQFILVFLVWIAWVDAVTKIVPRLGYGVLFKEVDTVDMSSSYWRHSFLIK